MRSGLVRRQPALAPATGPRSPLRGARILRIDDHPEWVAATAEALPRLGASVIVAESTTEALDILRAPVIAHASARALVQGPGTSQPDLILSDIRRAGNATEGTDAPPAILEAAPGTPMIFNIADHDPSLGVPDGAYGITARLGELFYLIMDALEGR